MQKRFPLGRRFKTEKKKKRLLFLYYNVSKIYYERIKRNKSRR